MVKHNAKNYLPPPPRFKILQLKILNIRQSVQLGTRYLPKGALVSKALKYLRVEVFHSVSAHNLPCNILNNWFLCYLYTKYIH